MTNIIGVLIKSNILVIYYKVDYMTEQEKEKLSGDTREFQR